MRELAMPAMPKPACINAASICVAAGRGRRSHFRHSRSINARSIAVRPWIDVVKLGANYRFGWGLRLETY